MKEYPCRYDLTEFLPGLKKTGAVTFVDEMSGDQLYSTQPVDYQLMLPFAIHAMTAEDERCAAHGIYCIQYFCKQPKQAPPVRRTSFNSVGMIRLPETV
jgi:hypothetical protein